jgi:hypothetical protein
MLGFNRDAQTREKLQNQQEFNLDSVVVQAIGQQYTNSKFLLHGNNNLLFHKQSQFYDFMSHGTNIYILEWNKCIVFCVLKVCLWACVVL